MNKNESWNTTLEYDTTFLEKLITVMKLHEINELVLFDLYENIKCIKQRGDVPTILGNQNTETEQLERQILDMISKNELSEIYKGNCFITLKPHIVDTIFSTMSLEERHDYFTLTKLYIKENMKKYQYQKTKS